eukprot:6300700-Prymnesium_polylepis.1
MPTRWHADPQAHEKCEAQPREDGWREDGASSNPLWGEITGPCMCSRSLRQAAWESVRKGQSSVGDPVSVHDSAVTGI